MQFRSNWGNSRLRNAYGRFGPRITAARPAPNLTAQLALAPDGPPLLAPPERHGGLLTSDVLRAFVAGSAALDRLAEHLARAGGPGAILHRNCATKKLFPLRGQAFQNGPTDIRSSF